MDTFSLGFSMVDVEQERHLTTITCCLTHVLASMAPANGHGAREIMPCRGSESLLTLPNDAPADTNKI